MKSHYPSDLVFQAGDFNAYISVQQELNVDFVSDEDDPLCEMIPSLYLRYEC